MLCENCRENEVNFKYTEVINGYKREILLCDKCAEKLGLKNLNFEKEFAEAFNTKHSTILNNLFNIASPNSLFELSLLDNFLPSFSNERITKYDYLEEIEALIKNNNLLDLFFEDTEKKQQKNKIKSNLSEKEKQDVLMDIAKAVEKNKKDKLAKEKINKNNEENEKKKLQIELEKAIKEERYEDAAVLRDKIKKMSV